jgi:hypothetical protein
MVGISDNYVNIVDKMENMMCDALAYVGYNI